MSRDLPPRQDGGIMTLDELIAALTKLRNEGTPGNAPIIAEGHDDESRFVQASVARVTSETRCEEEHEPRGVYLVLEEVSLDD